MENRIHLLLEKEQLSSAEFADKIGIQRPTVSHVLSGRNKPGYIFLQRILATFPSINARWLLLGEGDMYINRPKQPSPSDLFTINNEVNDSSDLAPYSFRKKNVGQEDSISHPKQEQSQAPKSDQKTRSAIEKIVVFYADKTFAEYFSE